MNQRIRQLGIITILTAAMLASVAVAQVLPEDRADALYHSYDGGGVKITGPSILLRKKSPRIFPDMQTTTSTLSVAHRLMSSVMPARIKKNVLKYPLVVTICWVRLF